MVRVIKTVGQMQQLAPKAYYYYQYLWWEQPDDPVNWWPQKKVKDKQHNHQAYASINYCEM